MASKLLYQDRNIVRELFKNTNADTSLENDNKIIGFVRDTRTLAPFGLPFCVHGRYLHLAWFRH